MKFTEGYWLRSERVKASYASQGFYAEEIPGGMRIVAPEHPINNRGDALNLSTITLTFVVYGAGNIKVQAVHYEAYDDRSARFELRKEEVPYSVQISDEEAVLTSGEVTVRFNRKDGTYAFEAGGKVLTSCGFRNLGYMRWDKTPSTMLPEENYLSDRYTPYMMTELSIKPRETVYGFGEQFTAFVKNGQVVNMWNEDGGTASNIAYKNIPFYMTSGGYGIFVDHTEPVSFEVASEKVEYVGFSVKGEVLRYHFIYGPELKTVLSRYTLMTGRPALPPAWSFGLWLTTSFTTNYDEETTSSFIDGMAQRHIPLRVFHFDCYWMKALHWCDFTWDHETFGNVKEMLRRYKEEKGLKICAWINPYVAQGTDVFREGAANGYFLKRADGKGVKQTDFWQPGMALVDFTNPKAVKWYLDKVRTVLEAGVDCVKTDFGERIPIDVSYYNGADPVSMHNYYTYLYNRAVFNLLKEVKGEKEAVLFARSATAGGQQFPVHWGGDCSASYISMAETLRGGLSMAMSGFSFWSHDISGFEQTASPDLYKRWVQFGLLSSHSRLHGSTSYRVPWLFDEEACDVVRYFTQLKCSLMPYIYETAVASHETGVPVMRPMILEFDKEAGMSYLDMQYMLGRSLLVAPIFNEEGKGTFYLPKGKWTDYFTGKVEEGGKWYEQQYDYFHLPLYIRENTLLAIGSNQQLPDYDYAEGAALHLYQLQDGCKAEAKIPDLSGKTVLEAAAERDGGRITLYISSLNKKAAFILHGVDQADVKGGIGEATSEGLKIIPQTDKVIIEV